MALVLVATLLGVSGTPGIARGAVANLGPTRLIVDPPCAPPQSPLAAVAIPTRFGISGRDFGPNQQLRLQFEPGGDNQPVDLGTVTAGPYGSFDTAADLVLPTAPGSYIIRAVDTANGDYQVVEPVQLPCLPSVLVTPRCGPADDGSGTVVTDIGVDGRAWAPDLPVTVTFLGPTFDGYVPLGDPVQTDPDQNGGFNVRLQRSGLATAVYAVRVDQPRIKTTIDLEFRVPCLTPTLKVQPTCAPAGSSLARYALQLTGRGFIAGRGVEIEFDPGPNAHLYFLRTDHPGDWAVTIEPYQRPPGTYEVIARQVNFGVVVEARSQVRVPCPEPAVVLDPPDCGPPQFQGQDQQRYELVVRGRDFREGPVTIVFDADSADTTYPPEPFTANADAEGGFAQAISPLRRAAGKYRILIRQESRLGNIERELGFRAPCVPPRPAFARTPVCGPEAPGALDAYTIRVRLTGYIPGPVELVFGADGEPETEIATVGANGRLTFEFTPNGRAAGEYRILAIQRDTRQTLAERSLPFTVPCPTKTTPTLRVDPPNAAPGFVTMVEGTGFPSNATLTLRWDRGIRKSYTVQCDAAGAFRLQVLIFRNDFNGVRQMSAGTAADPAAFPEARARLLVVPAAGSPSGVVLLPLFSLTPGLPLVFRR